MTSILESEYVEATRPYSQNELKFNREKLQRDFRLSKSRALHSRCKHFYLVRVNGRKEREMIETNSNDVGNCSVCWKLNKTPSYLKDRALDLVHYYTEQFEEEPKFLNFKLMLIWRQLFTNGFTKINIPAAIIVVISIIDDEDDMICMNL